VAHLLVAVCCGSRYFGHLEVQLAARAVRAAAVAACRCKTHALLFVSRRVSSPRLGEVSGPTRAAGCGKARPNRALGCHQLP
jgi:hypothetical protein